LRHPHPLVLCDLFERRTFVWSYCFLQMLATTIIHQYISTVNPFLLYVSRKPFFGFLSSDVAGGKRLVRLFESSFFLDMVRICSTFSADLSWFVSKLSPYWYTSFPRHVPLFFLGVVEKIPTTVLPFFGCFCQRLFFMRALCPPLPRKRANLWVIRLIYPIPSTTPPPQNLCIPSLL